MTRMDHEAVAVIVPAHDEEHKEDVGSELPQTTHPE